MKDDPSSHAVVTAVKVLDVTSRLQECAGQANEAVILLTLK